MRKGQSLFEVVFAIAIAALVVVTVVSLSNKSLGTTNSSADRSQATRYAQQMTECLREQRDTDWDVFVADQGAACEAAIIESAQFSPPAITFTCYDNVDAIVANCAVVADVIRVEADVLVTWEDGSGSHEVNSVTQYTDWRRQ